MFSKKTLTLVLVSTTVGMAAGIATAALSGLTEVYHTGPKIGGGGPYTQIGVGGDPAKGEAASFIIERSGQRPGMSEDDGPALVVKSNKFSAARFEGLGGGIKPLEANGRASSVFTNSEVVNTYGSKKDKIALTSVGALVIKGKDEAGAAELDSVRLAVENGKLYARFANGNEVVLATELD